MIQSSDSPLSKYKNQNKIHLFQIETTRSDHLFLPEDHNEVVQAIHGKIPLQKLIKHVHSKFNDEGLLHTLVHRAYESSNLQIQFYVPELLYMAVQKKSKPIRKLLIYKAKNCQNLRRLILWNLKAFTVLMKERDEELKKFCTLFEEEILDTVVNKSMFTFSEKAIAMLTTASLILKTMPRPELKEKLKRFIKRFNSEILNNLKHFVILPFRRSENDKYNSNYVVRIVEQNCSCFPTRKRVPYRIIIETIDANELKTLEPEKQFFTRKNVNADKQRDLYEEVKEEVEKMVGFQKSKWNFKDSMLQKYPYVIDDKELITITELTKYAKNIEIKEKELQKQDTIGYKVKWNVKKMGSKIMGRFSESEESDKKPKVDDKISSDEMNNNEKLNKFNATYIPTLPANDRKSGNQTYSKQFHSIKKIFKTKMRRYSDSSDKDDENIKIVEQEPKWSAPTVWGQIWTQTKKQLRKKSPFAKFNSLTYRNVVIKGGDDLRQEIICMQLIYKMQSIIKDAGIDVFIKPYQIIVLSQNSGLLEFVANSISIDGLKRQTQMNLYEFYHQNFPSQSAYLTAKAQFVRSLAGSSILTYVLTLKDRHNGNILIDNQGSIIHIDFGFILGMSPGGLNFESSPFKLTEEYVLLMGGQNSPDYNYFKDLFCGGMMALRKRSEELCILLSIMMESSDLDCFQNFKIEHFRDKFRPDSDDGKFRKYCESLVEKSCFNSRTVHYDTFQKITNDIMP